MDQLSVNLSCPFYCLLHSPVRIGPQFYYMTIILTAVHRMHQFDWPPSPNTPSIDADSRVDHVRPLLYKCQVFYHILLLLNQTVKSCGFYTINNQQLYFSKVTLIGILKASCDFYTCHIWCSAGFFIPM